MDIATRLRQFMAYKNIASSQFADNADIPRPTLSQLLNGRNKKISNELIGKIHEAFPSLNVMWLMFGEGGMECEPNMKTSEPQKNFNFTPDEMHEPMRLFLLLKHRIMIEIQAVRANTMCINLYPILYRRNVRLLKTP